MQVDEVIFQVLIYLQALQLHLVVYLVVTWLRFVEKLLQTLNLKLILLLYCLLQFLLIELFFVMKWSHVFERFLLRIRELVRVGALIVHQKLHQDLLRPKVTASPAHAKNSLTCHAFRFHFQHLFKCLFISWLLGFCLLINSLNSSVFESDISEYLPHQVDILDYIIGFLDYLSIENTPKVFFNLG